MRRFPRRSLFQAAAATSLLLAGARLSAQVALHLIPADPISLPMLVDSNTPAFWRDGELRLFSSTGAPVLHHFSAALEWKGASAVELDADGRAPMWIESVWQAGDGALYAWYHHERVDVCPDSPLTAPEIGALVSRDGGFSFTDLGIVLSSGAPPDCSAQNGYFATGEGDFSVIPDRDGQFLYFLFGSYGGSLAEQGVAIARIAVSDLDAPVGAVWKFYAGAWDQPGIGGRVTPVFPAQTAWQDAATDAFWGPSVHWNTYLDRYVMLLNRSCCEPGWPQEGVYLAFAGELGDPLSWSAPVKILDGGAWYPWALGLGPGETSSTAGQALRLFTSEFSEWTVVFEKDAGNGLESRRLIR